MEMVAHRIGADDHFRRQADDHAQPARVRSLLDALHKERLKYLVGGAGERADDSVHDLIAELEGFAGGLFGLIPGLGVEDLGIGAVFFARLGC